MEITNAKWAVVDLDNGDFGKGYYMSGFKTRAEARDWIRAAKAKNGARQSRIMRAKFGRFKLGYHLCDATYHRVDSRRHETSQAFVRWLMRQNMVHIDV